MHRNRRLWIPTFSSLFTVTLAGTSLQALFKAGVLAGSAAEAEVAVWKEGVMLQCRNQSDSCKWRAGCLIALAIVCNSRFFKCCFCQIQDLPFQALHFNAIVVASQTPSHQKCPWFLYQRCRAFVSFRSNINVTTPFAPEHFTSNVAAFNMR